MIETLKQTGILPIATLDKPDYALGLAQTLLRAGFSMMEITLRTDTALESISKIASSNIEMIIGAGTVLTVEEGEKAVKAGASFIVTPCLNEELIKWSVDNEIPIFPGCSTPSEIWRAYELGVKTIKFFPADSLGGSKTLKSIMGPFNKLDLQYIPTGGVNLNNMTEYARLPNILALGGSWVCPSQYVDVGDFEQIYEIAAASLNKLLND